MATEYKLSYTGAQIDEKLGKIDNLSTSVSQLSEEIADKVSKTGITLGLHSDGKYYVFVDGAPVGTGFELSGSSGDVVGVLDESNNILLSGNLADGTYTLKYENADGTYTEIGTLEVKAVEEPEEIINWIPLSTDGNDAVYNGTGYKSGTRLSSDGVTEKTPGTKACVLTGYIPVVSGDIVRTKNVVLGDDTTGYISYLWLYNSAFEKVSAYSYSVSFNPTLADGIYTFTVPSDVSGVAYMRLQAQTLDDTSIITVNQKIV